MDIEGLEHDLVFLSETPTLEKTRRFVRKWMPIIQTERAKEPALDALLEHGDKLLKEAISNYGEVGDGDSPPIIGIQGLPNLDIDDIRTRMNETDDEEMNISYWGSYLECSL